MNNYNNLVSAIAALCHEIQPYESMEEMEEETRHALKNEPESVIEGLKSVVKDDEEERENRLTALDLLRRVKAFCGRSDKYATMFIDRGCTVAVKENRYVPFPCKLWGPHFGEFLVYYTVRDFPSNNGNFKAVNHDRAMRWLNTHDVSKVYDKAGNLVYWDGCKAPVWCFTEE
jgi:hypothetical protein